MKSIKPGRGYSLVGGIAGICVALIGGIGWISIASRINSMMIIPGILFMVFALIISALNFKNAFSEKRTSIIDIVEEEEHGAPFAPPGECSFCPYCGTAAESDYEFCKNCGRKLP